MLPEIRSDEHLFLSPSLTLTRKILKILTMNSKTFIRILGIVSLEANPETIFTNIWSDNLAR